MIQRLISCFVIVCFMVGHWQMPAYAQDFALSQLPVPGTMVSPSSSFVPLALKGIVVNPQKPLEFQFIVDTGKDSQDTAFVKEEANKLVKYFLAGLTIPEGDLWVNLSPYEKDRMTPQALGQTDLGRDLLAQDYILKQLTASLIYPEKDLGKEFWSKVYKQTQERFGTSNVPVNTFNKVWILPNQAQVFENGAAAYVTQSTLKVMLDEDYLALAKNTSVIASEAKQSFSNKIATSPSAPRNDTHSLAFQIVREIVIPEIEKEVNTGKNFAPLRQIYQALILAKWYKETIKNGLLDALYTNKNKTNGVNLNDPAIKEQIYNRYLQAYKKGVFNYIKEDPTPNGQTTPRKYFSGGTKMEINLNRDGNAAMISARGALLALTISLSALMPTVLAQNNTFFQTPSVQTRTTETKKLSEEEFQELLNDLKKEHLSRESAIHAIEKLGDLGDKRAIVPLFDFYQGQNDFLFERAVALDKLEADKLEEFKERVFKLYIELLPIDNCPIPKEKIITWLGESGDKRAIEHLRDFMNWRSLGDIFIPEGTYIHKPYWAITKKALRNLGASEWQQQSDLDRNEIKLLWIGGVVVGLAGLLVVWKKIKGDSAMLGQSEQKGQDSAMFSKARIVVWKLTGNVRSISLMLGNEDKSVRMAAEDALTKLKATKEQKAEGYIEALKSRNRDILINAITKLTDLDDRRAVKPLLKLIGLDPVIIKLIKIAIDKLGFDEKDLLEAILGAIFYGNVDIILNGEDAPIEWLTANGKKEAIEPLGEHLKYSDTSNRKARKALDKLGVDQDTLLSFNIKALHTGGEEDALIWLGESGRNEVIGPVAEYLDSSANNRKLARTALTRLNVDPEILFQANLKVLSNEVKGYTVGSHQEAVEWLGQSGRKEAIGPITGELSSGRVSARQAARKALGMLGADQQTLFEANLRVLNLFKFNEVQYSIEMFQESIEALAQLNDSRAIQPLVELLKKGVLTLEINKALEVLEVGRDIIIEANAIALELIEQKILDHNHDGNTTLLNAYNNVSETLHKYGDSRGDYTYQILSHQETYDNWGSYDVFDGWKKEKRDKAMLGQTLTGDSASIVSGRAPGIMKAKGMPLQALHDPVVRDVFLQILRRNYDFRNLAEIFQLGKAPEKLTYNGVQYSIDEYANLILQFMMERIDHDPFEVAEEFRRAFPNNAIPPELTKLIIDYTNIKTDIFDMEVLKDALRRESVVVDIGAGKNSLGRSILAFSDQNGLGIQQVVGTDLNEWPDRDQERDPRLKYIVQDSGTKLPLPSNTFDTVIVKWVLHHMSQADQTELLRSIHRILKPGGQLIVFDALMATSENADILADLDRELKNPKTWPQGSVQDGRLKLTQDFLRLSLEQQLQVHALEDYFGHNFIFGRNAYMPQFFTYLSVDQLRDTMGEVGFDEDSHLRRVYGAMPIMTLGPPSLRIVFTKKNTPDVLRIPVLLNEGQKLLDYFRQGTQKISAIKDPGAFLVLGNHEIDTLYQFIGLYKSIMKVNNGTNLPEILISGGIGRGTELLRRKLRVLYSKNQWALPDGFDATLPEADLIRDVLLHEGFPQEKIHIENQSTYTADNFIKSRPILDRLVAEGKIDKTNKPIVVFQTPTQRRRAIDDARILEGFTSIIAQEDEEIQLANMDDRDFIVTLYRLVGKEGMDGEVEIFGEHYKKTSIDMDIKEAYQRVKDAFIALMKAKPEVQKYLPDTAMLGQTSKAVLANQPANVGGIDLNQINVARTGKTIDIQFDPAQLNEFLQGGFEGFSPIIIKITPISSPFPLLGINTPRREEEMLAKV